MALYVSNDVSVDVGILQFAQHLLETIHGCDWAKIENVMNSNPECFQAIASTIANMTQLNQMTM